MTGEYGTAYRHSLDSPDAFWAEAAEAIEWDRKWDKVLDDSNAPFYRWFSGGVLNTCHNALDRHVDGGRRQAAKDAIREDPARHNAENRRLRSMDDARHDRDSGGARRNSRCVENVRLRREPVISVTHAGLRFCVLLKSSHP